MQDRHRPTAFLLRGMSFSVHTASAAVQQHSSIPAAAQLLRHAIESMSFANAAEIDLDSGLLIANSSTLGVQHYFVHAGSLAGRFAFFGARHSSWSAEKSPSLDERSRRDVIGALGLLMNLCRQLKQTEEASLDPHGSGEGMPIEPADFAALSINRHLLF